MTRSGRSALVVEIALLAGILVGAVRLMDSPALVLREWERADELRRHLDDAEPRAAAWREEVQRLHRISDRCRGLLARAYRLPPDGRLDGFLEELAAVASAHGLAAGVAAPPSSAPVGLERVRRLSVDLELTGGNQGDLAGFLAAVERSAYRPAIAGIAIGTGSEEELRVLLRVETLALTGEIEL